MIDIHTHILPRLDDGAKDSRVSIELLKRLQKQGVETVVATPHYYGKRSTPEEFIKRRNASYERIKPEIPEGMKVVLGVETHFTGMNVMEYDRLCMLAIEGTKYILLEFPFTSKWNVVSLKRSLSEFIRETGYTPIIAHAERYREVQKNPSLINEFIEMGCLIQVNAPAFLNKREGKLAFALLKHGFVHCIGTDTHDLDGRAPRYLEAKEMVEKAGYSDAWKRAQENMKIILENGQVCVENAKPIKKIFGKYL